jgi:hypothetical protein
MAHAPRRPQMRLQLQDHVRQLIGMEHRTAHKRAWESVVHLSKRTWALSLVFVLFHKIGWYFHLLFEPGAVS